MAQYIKMTNGAVNVLVDVKDKATLQDKMADGFEAQLDKDGEVVLVDSSKLLSSEDAKVAEILNMVKTKTARKRATKKTATKDETDVDVITDDIE